MDDYEKQQLAKLEAERAEYDAKCKAQQALIQRSVFERAKRAAAVAGGTTEK